MLQVSKRCRQECNIGITRVPQRWNWNPVMVPRVHTMILDVVPRTWREWLQETMRSTRQSGHAPRSSLDDCRQYCGQANLATPISGQHQADWPWILFATQSLNLTDGRRELNDQYDRLDGETGGRRRSHTDSYGLRRVPIADMCLALVIGCSVEGDVDVGCGHLVVF